MTKDTNQNKGPPAQLQTLPEILQALTAWYDANPYDPADHDGSVAAAQSYLEDAVANQNTFDADPRAEQHRYLENIWDAERAMQ